MSNDRINYGMSRKISDGNYGSIDVHFSYSTDVSMDETIEAATNRCMIYVEDIIGTKADEIFEKMED